MIHGIGIDICQISRIARLLEREGEDGPFFRRGFTERERAEAEKRHDKACFYAGRFAVKEAVRKAAGFGDLRQIESLHREDGSPYVCMDSSFGEKLRESGLTVHISVSNEDDYAVAFAIAEKDPSK